MAWRADTRLTAPTNILGRFVMNRGALALAAVLASATSALAVESSVTMKSQLSAAELWKKVGDFCGIGTWHPAVEKCVLSSDGKQRTLSLKGGGTIVEALEASGPETYSYTILSGPLPVKNYHSTISVKSDGKASTLHWVGKYEANGASDAEAKKVIDGIYEAGEKALVGH
jgi:hypothetical protein